MATFQLGLVWLSICPPCRRIPPCVLAYAFGIETLEAFGYGISEPDDRNVLIRDVQTISRLYPTEYAAVLGAIPTEATVVE